MMAVDQATRDWLLEGDPALRLLVSRELGSNESEMVLRKESAECSMVRSLVDRTNQPWPTLTGHRSAGHPLHQLVFLSELGLSTEELGLQRCVETLFSTISPEGQFQVPMKISSSFGGPGKMELAWSLCDAPSLAYSLVRLGYGNDPVVVRSIDQMISLSRQNGWPCAVSPVLGKFRGPGRKDDPCPYANLIMLKLIAELPGPRDGNEARNGVETALQLWAESRERHPYQFYMGTDFRKLKAPFVWYDILHLAEVLSKYPMVRKDPRFEDIISTLTASAGPGGRYSAGSIWTAWTGWDLCQKTEPSRWITFHVRRILHRLEK
jgi:hypothetical protein